MFLCAWWCRVFYIFIDSESCSNQYNKTFFPYYFICFWLFPWVWSIFISTYRKRCHGKPHKYQTGAGGNKSTLPLRLKIIRGFLDIFVLWHCLMFFSQSHKLHCSKITLFLFYLHGLFSEINSEWLLLGSLIHIWYLILHIQIFTLPLNIPNKVYCIWRCASVAVK